MENRNNIQNDEPRRIEQQEAEKYKKGLVSLSYPKAPIRPLPTRQIVCVEYPGYIKNINKAIETLGGINAIHKVRCFMCLFNEMKKKKKRGEECLKSHYILC
jgi:hypothetical protein